MARKIALLRLADRPAGTIGTEHGLLMVHDGERRPAAKAPDGSDLPTTGFAFVRWERVYSAFER